MTSASAPHIGLIGGLAFRAGVFYYEALSEQALSVKKPLHLTLRHADLSTSMGHVTNNETAALAAYLDTMIADLIAGGADIVATTAIAPHLALDHLETEHRKVFVSALDVVTDIAKTNPTERFVVMGSGAVMRSNIYGALPAESATLLAPSRLDQVSDIYDKIGALGLRDTAEETRILEAAAHEALDNGATQVLLAGTDLTAFYQDAPPAFPHVDLGRAHITKIAEEARLV